MPNDDAIAAWTYYKMHTPDDRVIHRLTNPSVARGSPDHEAILLADLSEITPTGDGTSDVPSLLGLDSRTCLQLVIALHQYLEDSNQISADQARHLKMIFQGLR